MLLTVGRILRPHGVRGEVVVESSTDEPERRYAVGAILLAEPPAGRDQPPGARDQQGAPDREPGAPDQQPGAPDQQPGTRDREPGPLTVAALRPHQGRLIVAFQGVTDRDAAERLRGLVLRVDSAGIAPPADPDEFHDHQLIGLAAVTPAGERLGEIARVDHGPAADRLVLARPDGRTALVPFVTAIVPEVDVAGGRIVVDPPPGLLDL